MDPQKVQAVQNWETPKCVLDLQYFLRFETSTDDSLRDTFVSVNQC